MRNSIAVAFALAACAGTNQAASSALTVAEYERALDVCKDLAARESTKEAAADAFDSCAEEIDRRWCRARGLRCEVK